MSGFSAEQYIYDDVVFRTRDEAVDELSKTAARFGGKHIAYGIVNPGKRSPRLAFDAITTYPGAWISRYFQHNYNIIDPVLQRAAVARAPFDWNVEQYTSQSLKNFFGESIEHGLGRQGFAVPIHGPDGELCALSFNADVDDNEWREMRDEVLPHILLFAFQFNDRAQNVRKPKKSKSTLSPRESEVLKWAAEGKSVWETANILNISDHSVTSYLKNGQTKLQCCNKLHTVVTAMRSGIISPPFLGVVILFTFTLLIVKNKNNILCIGNKNG